MARVLRYKYQVVAEVIRERIAGGVYPPGSLLPNEAEISAEHEVSRSTVQRAMRMLQAARVVSALPSQGFLACYPSEGSSGHAIELVRLRTWLVRNVPHEMGERANTVDVAIRLLSRTRAARRGRRGAAAVREIPSLSRSSGVIE